MSATPERNAELLYEPVGDDADQLRMLVSALLGGSYKEEFYLWDVASVCRSKPDFARHLLSLIDRYQRLGQMPAAQYRRIRQTIEQSLQPREVWPPAAEAAIGAGASRADTLSSSADTTTVTAAEDPADPTVTAPLPAAAPARRAAPAQPHMSIRQRMGLGPSRPARPQSAAAAPVAPQTPTAPPMAQTAPPATGPERVPPAAAPGAGPATGIGMGTVLRGRYELQELLGCGGMASVYGALDRYRASLGLTDCRVAVKIATAQPGRPDTVAALGREFHHAQLLSHPNVVNVYEIDHEADASFYTMELLEGERLSQLTQRIGGPLPRPQALSIIRDIGSAIAHAHSRGVVHGDIKPHNVFVTYGGQVRLLDFGGLSPALADPWWVVESAAEERRGGYRAATPAYASCEQLDGLRADPRDDTYALACIAYELFSGRHPFGGKSSLEARAQGLRLRRPRGLPARSWHALRAGLAWKRRQRPEKLNPWLEQLGVAAAASHLPPSHQLSAFTPRRTWPQSLAATVLVLGCIGAVAFTATREGGAPWRRTLASAEASLQDARRNLQSAASPAAAPPPAATAAANGGQSSAPTAATAPSASGAGGSADTAGTEPRTSAHGRSGRTRTSSHLPRRHITLAAADGFVPPATPAAGAPTAVAAASTARSNGAAPQIEYLSGSGGVAFSAGSYTVDEDAPAARLIVRRIGSSRDDVSFSWWTVEDSARADVDFAPLGRRIEHIPAGTDNVTIYVPIISNPLRHQTATFYVVLGPPGGADTSAPDAQASVTIVRGG